jgi:hypothetical protein
MKTLHYSIIAIFSIIFIFSNNGNVFADNTNTVEIQNIPDQPSTIKVGDSIRITATLVNNSTYPIFVSDMGSNDCQGPFFTIKFDDHVKVIEKGIACSYVALEERLDPGKKNTGTSPGLSFTYIATESGTANATVTFPYAVKNQTDPNQSVIEQTVSKSFLFPIYDNKTNLTIQNYGQKPIVNMIQSPLKQFDLGTAANDIACTNDLTLVIKAEDSSPACVTPDTANILIERGWAINMSQTNHMANAKTNDPFGITALIIYKPALACLSTLSNTTAPSCPPNNFYLKINSNSTAYLLGYNICNDNSCAGYNNLSLLLPLNTALNPNYQSIGLPVDLQWKYGDTVNIQLRVSPNDDNKHASIIDLGNSTIIP